MKNTLPTIKSLTFTCPECGSNVIEDVTVNVSLFSRITSLNEDGDFEYDLEDSSDGELSHYQCWHCGYVIVDENGLKINDCLELVKWLKSRAEKSTNNG